MNAYGNALDCRTNSRRTFPTKTDTIDQVARRLMIYLKTLGDTRRKWALVGDAHFLPPARHRLLCYPLPLATVIPMDGTANVIGYLRAKDGRSETHPGTLNL